ncbi:TetR/AcrR family transcriptional regulator [Arthrobacter sp.]|uniref:TetR/AcrR family transcriptional regulator n=1 Tax=Arthrobacter sp. TaxID=1667 RepID=UPI0028122BCD|nr:TetR/AcrR family transcriptional regulator [Arthrobacter sp.]
MDTPQEVMGARAKSGSRTEEIRQAAAKLFEGTGYSSTTITDIANAVGILPGSLYHHFASKEDVALEIVAEFEREASELASALLARLDAPGATGARARLSQTAEDIADLSARNRAALRLIAYAAPTTAAERFSQARESTTSSLSRVWKRLVDDLVPNAAPDTQDVGLLRFALGNLTLFGSVNALVSTHPRSTADLHVAMLLDGIALDTPSDDDLDRSDAMVAAREAIAGWGPLEEATEPNSREHLVAAARTEFARRGFDATTVRDIAEAAQIRMGTLYRRVASKDELLGDILGAYDAHMDAAVRAVLTAGDSAVESLDALAFVMVVAKRRFRLESDIVKLAYPRTTAPATSALKSYWASTDMRLRLLEATLTRGTKAGSIRPLGAPAEIGPQIRYISRVPYEDFARASPERAHRFLRNSLLRGFLNPR